MWEEKILDKIKEKISLNQYKSAKFQFALNKESEQWKIIAVRITLDIHESKENRTLIEYESFTLEDVSLPIDRFLEFLKILIKSNTDQISIVNSTLQIPDGLYFELKKYRLCFVGNFVSDDLYFLSREQSSNSIGINKPVFQIYFSLHPSLLSKEYRKIDLSTNEIPFRDITEAINHFWNTHYASHQLSNNNFQIYLPIYDASIVGCKVKDKHVKLTLDINNEKIKPQELSVGVIAENKKDEGKKERPRIYVTENTVEFDLNLTPDSIYFSLSKGKERLDEFHWVPYSEKSRLNEILTTGFFGKATDPITVSNSSTTKKINNDTLDLPVLRDNFSDGIRVFISHKFVKNDQELALELQSILLDNHINGYLAERTREYELPISEKIQNEILRSDYLIAILTTESVKSASVNQEVGYALGVKVPVIIMAEKEILTGVLTHGREPEEFTREKFDQPCKNILEYIQKNGKRRRISEEERKEMIKNVYEPCYDGMIDAYKSREFITYIHNNPWEKISPARRLRTDEKIKELFENYSVELQKWNKMYVDFGNQFQSKQDKLGDILKPIFQNLNFLDESGQFNFTDRKLTPGTWLHYCSDVIFDETLSNEDELYQILKNHFGRIWGEDYSQTLDKWKRESPHIYKEIIKIIPELIKILDTKHTHQQLTEQRNILKDQIERLKNTLEEMIK